MEKKFGFGCMRLPLLNKEDQTSVDFVQLQINYIDWDNPRVQSRRYYEVVRKYNLPISVMEPYKGGVLANVPEKAEKLMKTYHLELSASS